MNLVELIINFETNDKCRERLKRLRWPEGVTCPRCKSRTFLSSPSSKNLLLQRLSISV